MFSQLSVQLNDHRAEFSRWWSKEMRAVKFPSQGTVFDYFIDSETKKFTPWSEKMLPFELEPDVPLQVNYNYRTRYRPHSTRALPLTSCCVCVCQTVLVHTPETICLTYFMDLLLQRGKPIMLVGNAGVGKTILVSDKVAKLKEDYMVAKVPFNYYTTSAMLQRKRHRGDVDKTMCGCGLSGNRTHTHRWYYGADLFCYFTCCGK